MTQEEKDILIKDLSARLPYGVIVETPKGKGHICDINLTIFGAELGVNINPTVRDTFSINDVKPYLFPLSSMTEEQKKELRDMEWSFDGSTICNILECFGTYRAYVSHSCCSDLIDWCIKNNFDYRGLIPLGLAIDATGLNIY